MCRGLLWAAWKDSHRNQKQQQMQERAGSWKQLHVSQVCNFGLGWQRSFFSPGGRKCTRFCTRVCNGLLHEKFAPRSKTWLSRLLMSYIYSLHRSSSGKKQWCHLHPCTWEVFCWEMAGRGWGRGTAWAPHVKTAPFHPFTCFLGLTFVHRLLSVAGTSHVGSRQALSYTMKPQASALHQPPPSGDVTKAIVVPPTPPQHRRGENHTPYYNKMARKWGLEQPPTQSSETLKTQVLLQRSIF